MPGRRAQGWRRVAFGHWVTIIALVALCARLLVFVTSPGFRPIADSQTYDRMASSLARTGSLPRTPIPPFRSATAYPPPLFPVVLAVAYRAVGPTDPQARQNAGRVLEALLGTAAVVFVCLITVRLFGPRVALAAGALAAIYPPLVLVGSSLMTESLFIPLVLAATLAALRGRDSPRPERWAPATGVLIALAALTRGNGIILALPLGLLLGAEAPRRRSGVRRRWRAATPAAMLLAIVVTLAPWTIRNARQFHELVPITTENGYALAGTYSSAADHARYPTLWTSPFPQVEQALARDPRLNEAQISDRLARDAWGYVRAHPAYPLKVAKWSAIRLLNLSGTGFERWNATWEGYPRYLAVASVIAFWLLGLLALLGVARGALRRAPAALWGVPVVILLSVLPFAGSTRYRSPLDPFLVMLAAAALAGVRRGRWRQGGRLPSAAE